MDRATVEMLHGRIFDFYGGHRRDFPWRNTTDRYAIMVSEIMLQQTQAERVVPRFLQWLDRFPDIAVLADAPLAEVLGLWSGLGYNSRAQRLHACAGIILREHRGVVPSDPQLLQSLPGIGAYTSRSIPIFADNLDLATVDTNIRRILIHELGLPETITPKGLQAVADMILPCGRSRDWHNALMDYGALVLTGRKSGIPPKSRQSRFEGSRRWYRGRLLKELLEAGELSREGVEERYDNCPYGIGTIVDALVREGLVEVYGSGAMLRVAGSASSGAEGG